MKKAAFTTLGCRVNQYESEALAESLIKMGYEIVPSGQNADLYVINTCAVTAESARKSAQLARKAARSGAKVAVIGCSAQLTPDVFADIDGVIYVSGCGNKSDLISFLKDDLAPARIRVGSVPQHFENLSVGFERSDLFSTCRAYIKIQDGCNCRCTYCTIPYARGASRSRMPDDILSEARRLASLGYTEVELTGIEVGAYSMLPLGELIKRVAETDGIRRIRLGSLSPGCITENFLSDISETEKFMPHMHISVQSGSEKVLRAMKRPYTADKLCEKLDMIKERLPHFQLSADIICGFPGETEEDFAQTLDLVRKYRFSHIHGFPYSERAGTPAAVMEGSIPVSVRRQRNDRLISLSSAICGEILNDHIGHTAEVLVETIKDGVCNGHTEDYIELDLAARGGDAVGDYIKVNVTSNNGYKMFGERIGL